MVGDVKATPGLTNAKNGSVGAISPVLKLASDWSGTGCVDQKRVSVPKFCEAEENVSVDTLVGVTTSEADTLVVPIVPLAVWVLLEALLSV